MASGAGFPRRHLPPDAVSVVLSLGRRSGRALRHIETRSLRERSTLDVILLGRWPARVLVDLGSRASKWLEPYQRSLARVVASKCLKVASRGLRPAQQYARRAPALILCWYRHTSWMPESTPGARRPTTLVGTVTLRFPTEPNVVFDDPPLRAVLCQLRFPPVYSLLGESGVAGFQEGLRKKYPNPSRMDASQLQLSPGAVQSTSRAPTWRFTDSEGNWRASIGIDFVALETRKHYRDFAEFIARLEELLTVLDLTVHPDSATRVGLRKINELAHPSVSKPSDWRDLLRDSLVGLPGDSDLPGFRHGMANVELQDEDDGALSIRHGFSPQTSLSVLLGGLAGTDSDDALGGSLKYLLDLDYSSPRPFELAPGFRLFDQLRLMSDSISSFFLWCLKDNLRDYYGPRPRKTADV
jgi:uncharacterized protein (TIGR04255 family)